MDKILVAPISRLSIVAARFVYVIVYSLLQVGIISVVALAIGVRPENPLLALLALVGYGTLLCAGLTVLSLALAFIFPHHSIFFAITGFLLTPLLVLSPTFITRDSMPGWMQTIATFNPMTHAIEPIRSAFLVDGGGPLQPYLTSAGWLLGFDVICFVLAVWVIKRRLA